MSFVRSSNARMQGYVRREKATMSKIDQHRMEQLENKISHLQDIIAEQNRAVSAYEDAEENSATLQELIRSVSP